MTEEYIYPVDFFVNNVHRYALWVESDGGDKFLEDEESGKIICALTKDDLDKISKRVGNEVKFEELLEVNVELVRSLINSIKPCCILHPDCCSVILEFFNISQDLARTTKSNDEIIGVGEFDGVLIKLFDGCDIPSMGSDHIYAVFDERDIFLMKCSFEKYEKIIVDIFFENIEDDTQ